MTFLMALQFQWPTKTIGILEIHDDSIECEGAHSFFLQHRAFQNCFTILLESACRIATGRPGGWGWCVKRTWVLNPHQLLGIRWDHHKYHSEDLTNQWQQQSGDIVYPICLEGQIIWSPYDCCLNTHHAAVHGSNPGGSWTNAVGMATSMGL